MRLKRIFIIFLLFLIGNILQAAIIHIYPIFLFINFNLIVLLICLIFFSADIFIILPCAIFFAELFSSYFFGFNALLILFLFLVLYFLLKKFDFNIFLSVVIFLLIGQIFYFLVKLILELIFISSSGSLTFDHFLINGFIRYIFINLGISVLLYWLGKNHINKGY